MLWEVCSVFVWVVRDALCVRVFVRYGMVERERVGNGDDGAPAEETLKKSA